MRELVTTTFEVLGLVLLVAAVALLAGRTWGLPAALAVAGVLLIGCSLVVTALAPRRQPDPAAEQDLA